MTDEADVFIQRSRDAERSKDPDAAIAHLRTGVEAWPRHPESRRRLVQLLLKAGRLAEADRVLAEAAPQIARRDTFVALRAEVDAALGRVEQACGAALDLALKSPDHFDRYRLALALCLSTGQADAARALADGDRTPTGGARAKEHLLLEKGCPTDLAPALALLEEALRTAPDDRALLALLTNFRLRQGRIAESWSAWQRTVAHLSSKQRQERAKELLPRIIAECRIDAFACAEMERASDEPPAARIARLARLVTEEPDHVGAALALMNAARDSGAFRAPARIGELRAGAHIPRRVAHYWPTEDLPPETRGLFDSWVDANPGVPCEVFSTATAEEFIRRTCAPATRDAFRLTPDPAVRADLFRLAYLAMRGGFFVDAHTRCRGKAVEALTEQACASLLVQEPLGSISASLVGSMPGQPFILHGLQLVTERILLRQRDRAWMMSGAGALTTAFCTIHAGQLGEGHVPAGVRIIQAVEAARFVTLQDPVAMLRREGLPLPAVKPQHPAIISFPHRPPHPSQELPIPPN